MTHARRTAIIVLGAAAAVWLSAALRGSDAKSEGAPESTPRNAADHAVDSARSRAKRTPRAKRAPSSLLKERTG
jgi:hypothetical protein